MEKFLGTGDMSVKRKKVVTMIKNCDVGMYTLGYCITAIVLVF